MRTRTAGHPGAVRARRMVSFWAVLLAGFLQAEAVTLRLDGDRIWLEAEDVPLTRILEHFCAAGVAVTADPAVQNRISGRWENQEAEQVLRDLFLPYSYALEWRRESGPLGDLTRLTGIRLFREGHAALAQPVRGVRRVQTSPDGQVRFMARELLVAFAPGAVPADLEALLARTGGTVIAVQADPGLYRILLPEGANIPELAAQLARHPAIALAEPNFIYEQPGLLPGPAAPPASTHWTPPTGKSAVAVSVLDTGVAADEVLGAALLRAFDALDPDRAEMDDPSGHGTLMARLAAGLVDPHHGAGRGGVPVVAVRTFDSDGLTDSFSLIQAVNYALAHSEGPLSLSWGSETPSRFLDLAIGTALNQGRPVFAAVGNENTGRPVYPAAIPGVIGVAASDGDGLAVYSNRGDFVDLTAPGSAGGAQGTSIATAYTAHLAARYMHAHPEATAAQVVEALRHAAGPSGILTQEAVNSLFPD